MIKDGGIMTNRYVEEANQLFDQAIYIATEKINIFEKTLWYRQLNYSEQMMSRQIILYFSEYMFDYHFQTLNEWDEVALQDVLLDIFPHKIVAGPNFFEKAINVLKKFFEFLYYHEEVKQGVKLSNKATEIGDIVLVEVEAILRDTTEQDLLSLGEELGLDISSLDDIDCLYRLAEKVQKSETKTQHIVPIKTQEI
ncbi:hypothetical protein JNUCC83_08965 [Vagococcus sp. JNUCC 83]